LGLKAYFFKIKRMRQIALVAHNLRSCHNVGSLLRTAEGLGVSKVLLSGYTPFPKIAYDKRLPHEAAKLHRQIHKTALGAEELIAWEHTDDVFQALADLKQQGFMVLALEQTKNSHKLPGFEPPDKVALLIGREVEGIEPTVLAACDAALEIPMFGQKESFNVVQAAAMALYHCTFM
jgi:tRNA G18 (ribose-2'-O)-methylase SpoU